MRYPANRILYEYWRGLKGERAAPDCHTMDLAKAFVTLSDAFVIETELSYFVPAGLCGARVGAFWPPERRSRSFLGIWSESGREDVKTILRIVTDDTTPVIAGAKGFLVGGIEIVDFELLLLPIRYFGKTHARVLGSLAPGERPLWLGRTPVEALNIVSLRVLGEETALVLPLAPGTPTRDLQRRPRFTVYEGGAEGSTREDDPSRR
ncbi:PAS domain-containing protein [Methylosinus sporium]|uniref:PAS domain-containing protein n=1 Tax=Methylosinus sporium TaxID=428 RepID=UPI00383AE0C4